MRAHYGEDWWFLTNYGWSMTENGQVAKGRAMTERGFELRRQNAYAAHALLHAMFEDGSVADADALVDAMDRRIRPRRDPAWPYPLASGARRARGWRCGEGAFDLCGRAAALRQRGAAAERDVRLRLAAVAAGSPWPCRAQTALGRCRRLRPKILPEDEPALCRDAHGAVRGRHRQPVCARRAACARSSSASPRASCRRAWWYRKSAGR